MFKLTELLKDTIGDSFVKHPTDLENFKNHLDNKAVLDSLKEIKKDNKDKGQRQFCGCIVSKDIGQYNTCPHLCEYCYANTTKATAVRNWNKHKLDPFNENIIGKQSE